MNQKEPSSASRKHSLKRKHQVTLTSFFGSRPNRIPGETNEIKQNKPENRQEWKIMSVKRKKNENWTRTRNEISTSSDSSRFGVCPICQVHFPMHLLYQHANACTKSYEHSEQNNFEEYKNTDD